ncbi:MAG: putative ABC transporter permease [Butyrivibrio sp.]|nr:putative ABC transporter permease [Butyrivibrio sp.]
MEEIIGVRGILLFFIYCALGWIWETLVYSICECRWVNRGFLRGPWLPVYGCGAWTVLLSTWIVRKNMILVFMVGMVSATILEYMTGILIKKLFDMRYWDYSRRPLNIKGHICLPISLGWGVVAVLLQKVNPMIVKLIVQIPQTVIKVICIALLSLFVIDVIKSVRAAFKMKELLNKMSDSHKSMQAVD